MNEEIKKIIPTQEELFYWKERLYRTLDKLSEYYEEITPEETDTLTTLLDKFYWWASNRNGGYFNERENPQDRYCAWLVQEYECL